MNIEKNFEEPILGILDRIPVISFYGNTRGWKFVLSWSHRIAGLVLVLYLLFHIYTLSLLSSPSLFSAKMAFYNNSFFKFLEWLLAVPLIFHALNGTRLILYESFGKRNDRQMIRWSFTLGLIYLVLLGFFMIIGDQNAPILFFWLNTLIISIVFCYYLYQKIWKTQNSRLWKLQRISGAFLLVMLPAHMAFMHINYSVGHETATVIARMQHYSIKMLDLLLVIVVLYHAAFGIYSIIEDYLENNVVRKGLTIILLLIVIYFGNVGAKFTLF
ncbi:MAG: succinate dehydrogenase, hydrophobic membrane anchor protein [Deltaproteobacteria bacterium]|nr:succinate dehydrogenase, hydrophobic membrane anchor protein [Deltaproteobacteria bacterium]